MSGARDRLGTTLVLVALFLACESFDPPTGPSEVARAVALSDCDPPPPPVATVDSFPVPIMDGGGLYGSGSNTPPQFHIDAGLAAAAQVPGSGAVLMSLGMSITRAAFDSWEIHARGSRDAVMVNGACGGCGVSKWDDLADEGWTHALSRLTQAGKTAADVDAVWMSVTRDQTVAATAADLETILLRIREAYPNVRQVFVSNRTYGGWRTPKTAEPMAWQDGVAVKQFVLNHLGETAPWVGWAGDLWAFGDTPRNDGLTWPRSDFSNDGLHYSVQGTIKVGYVAWQQFAANPFTGWYQR